MAGDVIELPHDYWVLYVWEGDQSPDSTGQRVACWRDVAGSGVRQDIVELARIAEAAGDEVRVVKVEFLSGHDREGTP